MSMNRSDANRCSGPSGTIEGRAPVAQWIEQPPPKGQVGRSIRLRGARLTRHPSIFVSGAAGDRLQRTCLATRPPTGSVLATDTLGRNQRSTLHLPPPATARYRNVKQ